VSHVLRVPLAVLAMLAGTITLTLLWLPSGERLPEIELPPRTGDWLCQRIGAPAPGREHYLTAIDLVRSIPERTLTIAAKWLSCSCPGER
jgi:hypothetical protein